MSAANPWAVVVAYVFIAVCSAHQILQRFPRSRGKLSQGTDGWVALIVGLCWPAVLVMVVFWGIGYVLARVAQGRPK